MRHLTDSLLLGPDNTTPQASNLALLMQSQTWPLRTQLKQGKIMGGIMLLPDGQTAAGEGTQYMRYVAGNLMDKEIASYDAAHQLLLLKEGDDYAVYDLEGRLQDTITLEVASYIGTESGNGGWVFAGPKKDGVLPFYIYAAGAKTLIPLMLPEPAAANDLWAEFGLEDMTGLLDEPYVYVAAYRQGQAAVAVYPDRLEFYTLEGGSPQKTNTIPIEDLFQDKYSNEGSARKISKTFMDLQGRVMAVTDGVATTIISLGKTSVLQRIFQDQHFVNDVAFSDDLGRFAIAYGEDPNIEISMRGGYFEVWKMAGSKPVFTTKGMFPEGIQAVRWGKGSALVVTISFDHVVRLWKAAGDADAGYTQACAPVTEQSRYLDAMIDDEGIPTVETDGNQLQSFAFMAPGETMVADLDNELYPILYVEKTAENELALLTDNGLNTVSLADGSVVSAEKAGTAAYASFMESRANQLQTAPFLMKGVSPLPFDAWPYQELLSKVYKEIVLPGTQTPQAGKPLKQALLSPDGSTAYVIGSVVPYVAAYSIDWIQKTTAIKQSAYLPAYRAPLAIYQNAAGKYLAVTLSNNDIWLYEAASIKEPLYKVRTETKGSIEAAAINEVGDFLAVLVKPSADEYMTKDRNLEIWYMPTGTCVLNRSVKNGSSLRFIDDYLYYSIGSRLYRLWLPTQSPSMQRIAFFNLLCGYRFDAYAVPYPATVDLKDVAAPLGDEWDQLYQIQEKSEEPTP
jgi:WD40 repeat protein